MNVRALAVHVNPVGQGEGVLPVAMLVSAGLTDSVITIAFAGVAAHRAAKLATPNQAPRASLIFLIMIAVFSGTLICKPFRCNLESSGTTPA